MSGEVPTQDFTAPPKIEESDDSGRMDYGLLGFQPQTPPYSGPYYPQDYGAINVRDGYTRSTSTAPEQFENKLQIPLWAWFVVAGLFLGFCGVPTSLWLFRR